MDWVEGGVCDEVGGVIPDDRARGKGFDVGGVAAVVGCSGDDARSMEVCVEVFGAAVMVEGVEEIAIIGATTQRAGTVASGEGDGFVKEEQLGVVSGLHDLAVPVFVFQDTGNPSLMPPAGAA